MASRSSASDDSLGQGELPLFDEPGEPPPPTSPDAPPADEASRRTFLGWDRPVLDAAADHLARGWDGRGALDLSDHLVVVATRHAGRRLRGHLARRAAAAEAAVVPPLVVTQDYLVSPDRLERPERPAADRHLSLLIGSALLLDVDLDRHRRLFPVDPVERDLRWAMKTARELLAVRNLLVESGLTFAEAATRLGEQDMEPGRWRDLAELESAATGSSPPRPSWRATTSTPSPSTAPSHSCSGPRKKASPTRPSPRPTPPSACPSTASPGASTSPSPSPCASPASSSGLREEDVPWQLSEDERREITLAWYRAVVARHEVLEREFWERRNQE